MADKIAVLSIKGEALKGLEGKTAQRVMRHLLSEGRGKSVDVFEVDRDKALTIKDLYAYGKYDVFVFINGTVFITHEGIHILSGIALKRKELSVIVPVSNEIKILQQRYAPPFIYQTISVFKWAAQEIYKKFKDDVRDVPEVDSFCFAFRKELLKSLPADCNLLDLPQIVKDSKFKFSVAKGVYAHRYGNVYESGREDLLKHVPLDAKEVLDIGCAGGLFGEMLKKRQKCIVTGIDTDIELINIAKDRLDKIINGDIEEIVDKGILGIYDCVVCGDLLEHLNNPWEVVKKLKDYLKKGGLFIASTPNIMNWGILFELLNGRWDYVPFSILSGTHIRFFTKKTLMELFEEGGYKIKGIFLQGFEIPPQGVEFIAGLKNIFSEINEEEVKASEIVAVAER